VAAEVIRKDIKTSRPSGLSPVQVHEEDFRVRPIRTEIFAAGDGLEDFVFRSIPKDLVREGMILAITSKIISLAEGAVVPRAGISKGDLIRREADAFLGETLFGVCLTIKHGILIPSAGIDESNSATGDYILFPKDPYASARKLHEGLSRRWDLKQWGIVVTDSHTQPLRKGVTGIGLAHWGFKATRDLIGSPDLFGREAKMTHVNVLDAVAGAAVYRMGEIAERCPLALVYGSRAEFTQSSSAKEIQISLEEDLYGALISSASVSRGDSASP
jgi:F420-0:gamma-glutamyl ligase